MINVIELFAGIRAPYKASLRNKLNFNVVACVENDAKVLEIANAMYGTNYVPQSVVDWHYNGNEVVDLIFGGSPCQSFSLAGLQEGGEEGSGTRSSLIWEQLRILKEVMPKYYIWENVKNVLSKKHKSVFDKHNAFVESLGYKVHYKVLNAKNFGIPQNRERVFVVAIRNDIENDFNFDNLELTPMEPLKNFLQTPRLKDYIYSDKQIYISKRVEEQKVKLINYNDEDAKVGTLTTQPYRGKLDSGAILEVIDTWYFVKKNSFVENHFKKSKQTENYWGKTKMLNPDENVEIGAMTTNQHRNINSGLVLSTWENKNGVVKSPIYTRNSENYCYDETSTNPINTIPTTQRTAKIMEPIETKSKHLKLNIYSFDNANNLHPLSDNLPLKTITTNTSKSGTTEKILDNGDNENLLVINWKNKLWNVRILTELECFRLMGFDDEDFQKAQMVSSRPKLYYVAGNSIVVQVLESIFKELFKGENLL